MSEFIDRHGALVTAEAIVNGAPIKHMSQQAVPNLARAHLEQAALIREMAEMLESAWSKHICGSSADAEWERERDSLLHRAKAMRGEEG